MVSKWHLIGGILNVRKLSWDVNVRNIIKQSQRDSRGAVKF